MINDDKEKHIVAMSQEDLASCLAGAAAAQANIGKKLINQWLHHQTTKYYNAAEAIIRQYKYVPPIPEPKVVPVTKLNIVEKKDDTAR